MIEVKEGVYWDEEAQRQSEEAMQWMKDEVLPKLAANKSNGENIQPTYDRFGRPVEWIVVTDRCTVVIRREYVNPQSPSWGMKKDIVTVNSL